MARLEISDLFGAEVERDLAEEDDEVFDRFEFAAAALDLLRPPRTRVALCAGTLEGARRDGTCVGPRRRSAVGDAEHPRARVTPRHRARRRGDRPGLRLAVGVRRPPRRPRPLPGRVTNYITREGAKRLQDELARLEAPRTARRVVQDVADAAAQGDRSENAEYIYGKRKLREIDRRIHFLTKRLESAEVVAPRTDTSRIFFGATVEVEDEDGKRTTYRIVGEDEIDLARGDVSWRSPLGRALLKREEGDTVVLRRPSGDLELTVMAVRYD